MFHLQQQFRISNLAVVRRFGAVVVDLQLLKMWHQANKMEQGTRVALADFCFGDIVPTGSDPRLDAGDVQIRCRQTAEPQQHIVCSRRREKPIGDGVASERGFKGVMAAFADGLIKPSHPFLPRLNIGRGLIASGCRHQLMSEAVGVVPSEAGALQQVAADRTLAGAIDAGEHKQDRA